MSVNKMVIMGAVIPCVMEKMKIFLAMTNMTNRFFLFTCSDNLHHLYQTMYHMKAFMSGRIWGK